MGPPGRAPKWGLRAVNLIANICFLGCGEEKVQKNGLSQPMGFSICSKFPSLLVLYGKSGSSKLSRMKRRGVNIWITLFVHRPGNGSALLRT